MVGLNDAVSGIDAITSGGDFSLDVFLMDVVCIVPFIGQDVKLWCADRIHTTNQLSTTKTFISSCVAHLITIKLIWLMVGWFGDRLLECDLHSIKAIVFGSVVPCSMVCKRQSLQKYGVALVHFQNHARPLR